MFLTWEPLIILTLARILALGMGRTRSSCYLSLTKSVRLFVTLFTEGDEIPIFQGIHAPLWAADFKKNAPHKSFLVPCVTSLLTSFYLSSFFPWRAILHKLQFGRYIICSTASTEYPTLHSQPLNFRFPKKHNSEKTEHDHVHSQIQREVRRNFYPVTILPTLTGFTLT